MTEYSKKMIKASKILFEDKLYDFEPKTKTEIIVKDVDDYISDVKDLISKEEATVDLKELGTFFKKILS